MREVTDPTLLEKLNGPSEVTDPATLAKLNAPPPAEASSNRWVQKVGEAIPAYNRMVALSAAATDPLFGVKSGDTFGERYRRNLGLEQAQSNQTQADHPWLSAGATGSGAVLLSLLTGPAGKAAEAAGTGWSALRAAIADALAPKPGFVQGVKVGAGMGGMYAAGAAPAGAGIGTIAAHTVGGMIAGGVAGGPIGALTPSHGPNPEVMRAAALNNRAAASAEALAAARGGNAVAENATDVIVRPSAPRGLMARVLEEPTPTREAQFLLDRGVPLTTGMRDPASPAAQTEIASQTQAFTGPVIRSQRHTALVKAMDLGFREALPPGEAMEFAGSPQQKLDALANVWNEAYTSVKSSLGDVYPAIHNGKGGIPLVTAGNKPGAISIALRDPDLLADKQSIGLVERFVNNQFTKLPEWQGAIGKVSASDLLDIRNALRQQQRKAMEAKNWTMAGLFDAAETQITRAVESQAPGDAVQALKSLDGRYFNFKVMQNAVLKAKDSPAGITPASFSQAVYDSMANKSAYARGGGGAMRDLSSSIRTVFDESSAPPTGARLGILDHLPWAEGVASRYVTAPTIILRNRQIAKAAGGDAAAQSAATSSVEGIMTRLQANPSMAPYASIIGRVSATSGTAAAASLHFLLTEKDPAYRAATSEQEP